MSEGTTRREFLGRGGMIAVGLMAPGWLAAVAKSDLVRTARGGKVDPDNVLVVVELTGGNDGLNTVIPWASADYYRLRPNLAVRESDVLKLDDATGLHPSMAGVQTLFREGKVAIVQGVGYPNPNRSHFKSMDIWQSASPDGGYSTGWIGRHFDLAMAEGPVDPIAALGLSVNKPRALTADKASIPCFASLADVQAMVGNPDSERLLREIQGRDAAAGSTTLAIQEANRTALDAMAELQARLGKFAPTQKYGDSAFGRGFQQVAQIVATSPATRVVYFSVPGFDTHARQGQPHANLLKGFSDGLLAFQREMEACGRADKVVTMVFSEFGRRSYENGSLGTDHGKAAPMFVVGKHVKGGLYGPRPDLTDLDDGDLRWKVDFRQVYATALDGWMGSDSGVVLGQTFAPLAVLK